MKRPKYSTLVIAFRIIHPNGSGSEWAINWDTKLVNLTMFDRTGQVYQQREVNLDTFFTEFFKEANKPGDQEMVALDS